MPKSDAKTLYENYYYETYQKFILSNNCESLSLPGTHWFPLLPKSEEEDEFTKKAAPNAQETKVKQVKKNGKHHGILWTTEPEKIKEGVRWGIIKAQSITGQVIGTLGRYRAMITNKRISIGRVTNRQGIKNSLLDVYQDRMEALQVLESLVNTKSDLAQYDLAIKAYEKKLEKIREKLKKSLPAKDGETPGYFSSRDLNSISYEDLPDNIDAAIDADIKRAWNYFDKLKKQHTQCGNNEAQCKSIMRAANRARGNASILHFVKQQMDDQLDELQGVNQDVVFSGAAATRGDFNDYIVDAHKVIKDHKPDLRDAVTPKHHGEYHNNEGKLATYDFSLGHLSREEEEEAVVAISFIEGWDKIDYYHPDGPKVFNQTNQSQRLDTITAPKWNTHRRTLRYCWEYVKTWFKGLVGSTRPWEEGVSDNGFELYAVRLKKLVRKNDPMVMKLFNLARRLLTSTVEIFTGIYHSGIELIWNFPDDIRSDWYSSLQPLTLDEMMKQANIEIKGIAEEERKELDAVYSEDERKEIEKKLGVTSILAQPDYPLVHAEDRDPLTAVTQALGIFSDHFTHDLFAKDPIGGLFFTSGCIMGFLPIVFPAVCTPVLGTAFVNLYVSNASLFGSTPLMQGSFVGLLQGTAAAWAWDTVTTGPSSKLAGVVKTVADDPMPALLMVGVSFAIGFAIIYTPIPGDLGQILRDELGSSALSTTLNAPVIGAKTLFAGYVMFRTDEETVYRPIEIRFQGNEIKLEDLEEEVRKDLEKQNQQLIFLRWLNANSAMLHKLDIKTKTQVCQLIDIYFEPAQANSLRKLLFPEKERTAAYQLFAIPLSYFPALLRLFIAMGQSLVALACGNHDSAAPIVQAGSVLLRKIDKDLSRLVTASSNLLSTGVDVIVSPFKALVETLIILIGRTAIFGWHPGPFLYKSLGVVRGIYQDICEFWHPTSMMKSVVFADPAHAMNEVMGSYERMVTKLGTPVKKTVVIDRKKEEIPDITEEQNKSSISQEDNFSNDIPVNRKLSFNGT